VGFHVVANVCANIVGCFTDMQSYGTKEAAHCCVILDRNSFVVDTSQDTRNDHGGARLKHGDVIYGPRATFDFPSLLEIIMEFKRHKSKQGDASMAVEDDDPFDPYVSLICDDLRYEMGGKKFCKISEITRDTLLRYVFRVHSMVRCEIVVVVVMTLSGDCIEISMARGRRTSSVYALKVEIEENMGVPVSQQILHDASSDDDDDTRGLPLCDEMVVKEMCTVFLTILPPLPLWDVMSPLLACGVMRINKEKNTIEKQIDGTGINYPTTSHSMPILPSFSCGVHTVSIHLEHSPSSVRTFPSVVCGLVSDGASPHFDHAAHGNVDTSAWMMDNCNGAVLANFICINDKSGECMVSSTNKKPKIFCVGDIITMQADLDMGTLLFWLNGEPFGKGFTNIMATRSLHFAVCVPFQLDRVRIVSTPPLTAHYIPGTLVAA
jgi:hypothetical protein